ncbi:head-tail connector protein [Collimonas pratensis]|uniref:Phage gp6-like head-tail connector family protein n=1 Tax=Collimonas pratensis TaxID=279113 RepID=A0ABN4MCC8_9BURK|nr:head-tail connector protein [Collimonas pratensis]AMP15493.1 phage gp6-like head-tail connector family protein [Collimonas pratensis]
MATPLTDKFGLAQARAHLRLDPDDDDPMIALYMEAAVDRVEQHIQAPLGRNVADVGAQEDVGIPPSLKAAVLLFLGDFWENREASFDHKMIENRAAEALMAPYRTNLGV